MQEDRKETPADIRIEALAGIVKTIAAEKRRLEKILNSTPKNGIHGKEFGEVHNKLLGDMGVFSRGSIVGK